MELMEFESLASELDPSLLVGGFLLPPGRIFSVHRLSHLALTPVNSVGYYTRPLITLVYQCGAMLGT